MPVTSWIVPGTTGGTASSTANITASDDARSSHNTGQTVIGTNYSFSIPSGATIDGVEVEAEYSVSSGTWTLAPQLYSGGATIGTAKSTTGIGTLADVTNTYGSSSDLWGATLDDTTVNDSGFGVQLTATRTAGAGSARFRIDQVRMRVHYTESPLQPLTPTTSFSFSSSATIKGLADAVATSSPVFSGAATAKGSASIAASASLEFTAAADGDLQASLAGSASLAFSASATVSEATGGTDAGYRSINAWWLGFDLGGEPLATGELAGSSDVAFACAAAIKGRGGVAATSSVAFVLDSSLDAFGGLTATSSAAFDPTVTAKALANVAASTSFAFTSSASVIGGAGLAAASSLAFTSSATIDALASIAAASSLAFTSTATATATASLTATSLLSFTSTATVTFDSDAALFATTSLVFSGSSETKAIAGLKTAPTAVSFSASANAGGVASIASDIISLSFSSTATTKGLARTVASSQVTFAASAIVRKSGVVSWYYWNQFGLVN